MSISEADVACPVVQEPNATANSTPDSEQMDSPSAASNSEYLPLCSMWEETARRYIWRADA